MGRWATIIVVSLALGLTAGWLWRRRQAGRHRAASELAQRQFGEQRQALPSILLQAANQTGKPRGLSWETCELSESPLFALDRRTGELCALIGATIGFAAIPGGDMEEVEAVGNLRYGTVIFVYRNGKWQSDGQVVFNLEPDKTMARFEQSLSPI